MPLTHRVEELRYLFHQISLLHHISPHDTCLIPTWDLQVPSSPTCSSPERGGEQDSLYGDGYSKIYNRYNLIQFSII